MSEQDFRAAVARRITVAREVAGLNKTEMARRLHMSNTTYWYYEEGRYTPDIYLMTQIAEVTGRSLAFFLPGVEKLDVAAALKEAYPDIEPGTVQGILAMAEALVQRDRGVRSRNTAR